MAERIGLMLGAAFVLAVALAMDQQQVRQEQQQEMCLVDLLPELVLDVVERLLDPNAIFRFAVTCKKAYNIVKSELLIHRAERIFCYKTPINEIPDLIRDFSQYMQESPDLQQIAASLTPQQVVRLFDSLLDVTHYSALYESDDLYEDQDHFTMRPVSNPKAVFKEEQVVEMVISLIKAVNRPVITRMTSVLLSPGKCLTQLVSHLDPLPSPTNIPEPIIKYIKTMQKQDLSDYDVPDLISSIRTLFPPGFRVFPENADVAYDIVSGGLSEALSIDPEHTLLSLLSVGIRFDSWLLSIVPLAAESLPAIFSLFNGKTFAFDVMRSYSQEGQHAHALALLRTIDVRVLIDNYPVRFANFVSDLIFDRNIDLIRVLVQEQFLNDVINLPISNYNGLLLLQAIKDSDTVEIAKLLMTVPGIDLYQPPRGWVFSPIQLLLGGVFPEQVAYQILHSTEFQNLMRSNTAAFHRFLQETNHRQQLLQSLCPDFASEIMKSPNPRGN